MTNVSSWWEGDTKKLFSDKEAFFSGASSSIWKANASVENFGIVAVKYYSLSLDDLLFCWVRVEHSRFWFWFRI